MTVAMQFGGFKATPPGGIYTQEFLDKHYGPSILETLTPMSKLILLCKEKHKPNAVFNALGDNETHGSKTGVLAQVIVGNFKTVGQGEDRKKAKQVAANAMLIALHNNNRGAQMLKYNETVAGQQRKNNGPNGWSLAIGKKTVPAAKATVPTTTTKVSIKVGKKENTFTVTKTKNEPAVAFNEPKPAGGAPPKPVISSAVVIGDGPLAVEQANAKIAEVLNSGKNPIAYCEEASSIFQQSLKWVFKEQKIGNNKSLFTCTATFGAATASDECLQKKAAKNNAATKLMPKILATYGCPQAKQHAKKRNAQTSGRGGRGGKRGRRT